MSCDSNGGSYIYVGIEPLIPLVIFEVLLTKTVKCHFLFIHGGEWELIFCLGQYGLLNKGNALEFIIACDYSVPIGIMLHLVN